MAEYIMLEKNTLESKLYRNANSVAAQLLGRKLSNFIIIKCDDNGNRVYTPETADVFQIEKELGTL